MALLQPITLENGIVAEYWRIRRIIADYSDGAKAWVEMGGYPNRETRLSGYAPVKIASYEIGEIAPPDGEDDLRGAFYVALLELPEFAGAQSD